MGKFEYMKNTFGSTLKPRARLVLQCLVYHADKEGTCFPALKTIAVECGYSLSTVKRALRELCEAGYIVKKERFDERKNGGQTSNLYILAAVSQNEPDADTSSESTGYAIPRTPPTRNPFCLGSHVPTCLPIPFPMVWSVSLSRLLQSLPLLGLGGRSFLYPLEQYR